jgi:predicted permease
MLTVFLKVLMIFLMVGIGFVANRTGVLPRESNKYLVNLLLLITTPCMVLGSMAENRLSGDAVETTLEVIIGSFVFFALVWILAAGVVRLLHYDPVEDRGVMICIICGINTGFMGFPVTKAIFGSEFLFYMVMENIVLNIYLYSISIIQLNQGSRTRVEPKVVLASLCNMCLLASAIGVVLMVADIRLPDFVQDFLNTVGSATVPVSMIVVGIQLGTASIRTMLKNYKLIVASVVNVAVVPVLTFFAVNWLPITWKAKVILILAAAFPCAVVLTAMAIRERKNGTLMAQGVALTTLMSVVTLPVCVMFLTAYYF